MRWNSLVEKVAGQREQMDRLARDGVLATPSPETIAFFVRYHRGLMGWKRETLAGFARVSLSTIERIERSQQVSAESLDRVAEALQQAPGAFTAPRVPLSSEEAWRKLSESAAPFEGTIAVPVRPLRGRRQVAELARTHCFIVDAGRLGGAYDDEVVNLREWLDLTSFILASEDKGSILQTDAEPVKRCKLYDDVLGCVRELERRANAVALAGTYQAETGYSVMPQANVALIGFFPKLTDPAAINRKTLLAPARLDWSMAWRQFCEGE